MMKEEIIKNFHEIFKERCELAREILGDYLEITYEWNRNKPSVMTIKSDELSITDDYNLTVAKDTFISHIHDLKTRLTRKQAKKELNEILDQSDNVNHPSHYKQGNIECIDAMRQQFTKEEVSAFCKLNAFKYLWRSNHKGTHQQDIDKANWYLSQISSTYVKGE